MKLRATTLVAAFLGILACGLLLLAIYQGIAGAAATHAIAGQRQALAALRRSLRENTAVTADYEEMAPKLGPRMRACTWNEQLPFMMTQLTAMTAKLGISLATVQPEPMTTQSAILRFPMRVSFHTNLARLTSLLRDVKTATPLLKIERLAVRDDPTGSGTLLMEMTVASFVILDKSAPRTEERALPAVVEKPKESPRGAVPTPTRAAETPRSPAPATPARDEQPSGWLRPPPTGAGTSNGAAAAPARPPAAVTENTDAGPAPAAAPPAASEDKPKEAPAATPDTDIAHNGEQP